jgi:hypothetical protein
VRAVDDPETNGDAAMWSVLGKINRRSFFAAFAATPVAVQGIGQAQTNERLTGGPGRSAGAAAEVLGEDPPSLIATPTKMWAIVGQPCYVYYQPLLHRDASRTDFLARYPWQGVATNNPALNNPSGGLKEGVLIQNASPGVTSLVITASVGGVLADTRTITIATCAQSDGGGTKRFLAYGDSMMAGGGLQSNLRALAKADGITGVINVGTMGNAADRQEGYSGKPTGIFFTPGNPSCNPITKTFDFSHYVETSLGGVAPTHVLLASGFWDVANALNDEAAKAAAASTSSLFRRMVDSIHAHDPAIKVAVWAQPSQPRLGSDGLRRLFNPAISQSQLTRNLRIQAGQQIATFSGLEASNTFVLGTNAAMNPETAYPRTGYLPSNDAVSYKIGETPYAKWADALSDLKPADGSIRFISEGSVYVVKVGPPGVGNWRPAMEADGFERRFRDVVHMGDGHRQIAQQIFAWIKNNP